MSRPDDPRTAARPAPAASTSASSTPAAAATQRVWDPLVRATHWTLVAGVAVAWLSTLWIAFGPAHQPGGYVALGAVLLRIVWGFAARSRHARFAAFVRGPRATWAYARAVAAHREPRHLGHNPLGAWMILALMACVIALAVTGWLYTTDRFWGDETVETVHRAFAWTLYALVPLHVAGVVFTGVRQRENLVRAMLTGRKPSAKEGDAD